MRNLRRRGSLPAWITCLALALGAASCGPPKMDAADGLGKQAIIDETRKALTDENCSRALEKILPVYKSEHTDNEVRMLTASAFGCRAKLNFFKLVGDLSDNSSALSGAGLWALFAKLFPSTTGDARPESAVLGVEALQASLNSSAVLTSSTTINAGTYNPGSTVVGDRVTDANAYLAFLAMPAIGGLQSRYGAPDATSFKRTVDLPWTTVSAMTGDGCAYAASVINFVDAIGAISGAVSSNVGSNLKKIHDAFALAIDAACAIGCAGIPAPGVTGWQASGCALVNGTTPRCTGCPLSLRNASSCSGVDTDAATCAAAGIVNFINYSPAGWQKGP